MTRTPDLQAEYDAADQRMRDARLALTAAQEDRARAANALALSRVPADVLEHAERVRQAGELTAAEQAERQEAQAAYDVATATYSAAPSVDTREDADRQRRQLNAVIRRTDAARQDRRRAVRAAWSRAQRTKAGPVGVNPRRNLARFLPETVIDGWTLVRGKKVKHRPEGAR